ncbi:MAG TPA: SIMPL domain-containing protein [Pyrinomonadaceae bacterium]|jgi:hypothetical protein
MLAALLVFFAALPVFAQDAVDRPLITVSGQAEIMVVPDEAVFTMSAVTVDKDLLNAQARNDEIVKKVLALGRKYQVPANLLQTGHISLDERYSDEEATRKPRIFLGYEVTKRIAIVLRDVSKAEELLADIFKSGITRISDVEFRTTQIRKYKDQARAMAIKAAQEKATALTREIGQSIGKAYSISEEGLNYGRNASNAANFSTGVGGSSSDDESTIALGQISITARVIVSFELK